MTDKGVTVVIAGNKRQFDDWCHRQNLSPRDKRLVYASRPDYVHGFHIARVVKTGTWFERRDLPELRAAIQLGLMEGVEL